MSNSFNISFVPLINDCIVLLDAIKLKTDVTPQKVRGQLYHQYLFHSSADFQDVVNVTGQGKLLMLSCLLMSDSDSIEILLSLDGKDFGVWSHTGDITKQFLLPYLDILYATPMLRSIVPPLTDVNIFGFEFDSSLLIQSRRSAGTGGDVKCAAIYLLDDF